MTKPTIDEKQARARDELNRLYPGLTNEQVTDIQRQRLEWAQKHPLSTDLHPTTAARIDVGERGGVLCRCGWHGYRGELMRQDDWERTHPANKNLSMEDMKAGRGHVTKFESCPNCGRAIFADGFPTGIAKALEPLEETA